jgi:hypothetical protein
LRFLAFGTLIVPRQPHDAIDVVTVVAAAPPRDLQIDAFDAREVCRGLVKLPECLVAAAREYDSRWLGQVHSNAVKGARVVDVDVDMEGATDVFFRRM